MKMHLLLSAPYVPIRVVVIQAVLATALLPGVVRAEPRQQKGDLGFGVEWKLDNGCLRVIKVLAGSPAERAGLAKDDRVLVIDGAPTGDLSEEKLAGLLKPRVGAPLLLTVISGGYPVRVVRLSPGIVEFPNEAKARPAVLAFDEAFKRRIARNIERLRVPVANEVRFLTKVASLSDEQVELLEARGWPAIERGLWPNENGRAGLLVLRGFVEANGALEPREELMDAPQSIARSELAKVLQQISRDAWKKAEAERRRLERRRRWADVLVQVAAFDHACLLTRPQREALGKLLFDQWPELWRGHVTGEAPAPSEFALSAAGAMDLFSMPEDTLKSILLPSQIATFQQVQLPTKLEAVLLKQPPEGARVLHHGLPLAEECERLRLLLQRLIEDAGAHAALDEAQKQKLMLAGKLDIVRYAEGRTEELRRQAGKIALVKTGQTGGAKVRLPPIFSGSDSMFLKALRQRLNPAQIERLAAAHLERRRFHVRAALHLVAADLADAADLTDEQEAQLLAMLDERSGVDDGPPATVETLRQIRAEDVTPLLDDWQAAAARDYLNVLARSIREIELRPVNQAVPVPAAAGGGVF